MDFGRTAWNRLYNHWSHHPATDFILATATVVVLAVWQGDHFLARHAVDQRMNIYATVASVAAIVGGFGTAAISQYATSSGSRMAVLRAIYGVHLRRNWVGMLTSLVAVSGGCLGVMISDTGKTIGWPGWIVEVLVVIGAYRAVRLVWLFRLLIDVSDYDAERGESDPTVQVLDVNDEG